MTMAAALVILVVVDTAITGWLLSQHHELRSTVVECGGIVLQLSDKLADLETKIAVGRDDARS